MIIRKVTYSAVSADSLLIDQASCLDAFNERIQAIFEYMPKIAPELLENRFDCSNCKFDIFKDLAIELPSYDEFEDICEVCQLIEQLSKIDAILQA